MKQTEIDAVQKMYEHYNWYCFLCDEPASHRAHIISNSKLNRKQYGNDIIDNPLNWLPACNLEHNALIDIGKNDLLIDLIVFYIKHGDRENIEDLVRGNVKRKRSKK